MKQLRVTAAVDEARAPAFYTALADSPAIEETHVVEWNAVDGAVDTVLFAVRGDARPFADAVPGMPGVDAVELSGVDRRWTYALAETSPRATRLFEAIHRARARSGLVVRKPIVYRDGDMAFRVVGDAAALQAGLEAAPDAMDVRVEAVGSVGGPPDRPDARLTDRQREAVVAARALGYYEQPRTATLSDVAAELGCTAVTAGEHVRKAEAKLVDAALAAFPPDGRALRARD